MATTAQSVSPAVHAGSLLPEALAFRKRFPIFDHKIHLANNAMGGVSDAMERAHRDFLDERIEHGASWHVAVPKHEELRRSFADFIGAEPHEIAIGFAATQSLGVLSSCFDWTDRPVIVFDDYSFPSVTHLWHAQTRRGAQIRRVSPDADEELWPEAFDEHLDTQVKLVSCAHVCYKNGHRLHLPGVAERAHDVGALMVVDDYQSCGSQQIDVKEADVDVLVTGAVKYLLGSPGVSMMYVREELLDQLHPTVTGWFAQRDPDAFQIHEHQEAPDAGKFQSGTPALSPVYDALAGLELIKSVGMEKIEPWIDYLTATLMDRLHAAGFVTATPTSPAIRGAQVSIRAKDGDKATAELAKRGITCTTRDNNVRTAWHFYNTPEDISAVLQALEEIRPMMVEALD